MDGSKKHTATKLTLILRIVVAANLLYTVWELRGAPAAHVGGQRILFIAAMIVFTVIAVILGGFSLKALLKGEYEQPGEEEPEGKE